jgi:hypothetical protein
VGNIKVLVHSENAVTHGKVVMHKKLCIAKAAGVNPMKTGICCPEGGPHRLSRSVEKCRGDAASGTGDGLLVFLLCTAYDFVVLGVLDSLC